MEIDDTCPNEKCNKNFKLETNKLRTDKFYDCPICKTKMTMDENEIEKQESLQKTINKMLKPQKEVFKINI